MFTEKKITFDSFIRGILSATVIIGVLYMLNKLSNVLLPFFIAWLIAYLVYPAVFFVQDKLRVRNRALSILIVLLAICILIAVVTLIFLPPMITEFTKLKDLLADFFIEGSRKAQIPGTLSHFIQEHIDMKWIYDSLSGMNISDTIKGVASQMWSIISTSYNVIMWVVTGFIMLLYLFFILLDYEEIADGWVKLVPAKHRNNVIKVVNDVKFSMNQYFRGQALVAFLVGVLFSIGFLIIDFPMAVGLGLFIGLLNMVPYLQIIGFVPTILLALLKAADTGENFWWISFCALMVFCIVQLIQDSLLVPKIMGKITGLNPAIILLSLSVWGSLMGILGMIIALPCTTLLLSYYQRYIKREDCKYKKHNKKTPAAGIQNECPE